MHIAIVTDSTSDLPAEIIKEYSITVIPFYININGKSYLDGLEISRKSFYEQLPSAIQLPTTSAPGPGIFLETYESLIKQGATAIFSIHLTKQLSNIYNVASLAAENINTVPVHVIDSGNLTLAEGFVVLRAAQAVRDGADEEQILRIIQSTISRAHTFAKLDTADYLQRGGRISSIQHGIISLLDIKPILKMNNGIAKMEMVRTRKKAFARVLEKAKQVSPQALLLGITHANALEQVEKLLFMLHEAHPDLPIPIISEVTPTLVTHVGPGAVCLSWI
jgi:DegV family protein with EDD domain